MERFRRLLFEKSFAVGYADSRPPEERPYQTDQLEWAEARRIEVQVRIDKTSILQEIKRLLDSLYGSE